MTSPLTGALSTFESGYDSETTPPPPSFWAEHSPTKMSPNLVVYDKWTAALFISSSRQFQLCGSQATVTFSVGNILRTPRHAQTLQVIYLRLTCDKMSELIAMASNKSFIILYLRSFDISVNSHSIFKQFLLLFSRFHRLHHDSSYNMVFIYLPSQVNNRE